MSVEPEITTLHKFARVLGDEMDVQPLDPVTAGEWARDTLTAYRFSWRGP